MVSLDLLGKSNTLKRCIQGLLGGKQTHRQRLICVWLSAGSAFAVMLGTQWLLTPSEAITGDMVNHAIASQWLRSLPWWDWRGWSDWFYGGQALGVSYPPLWHAWLRFTDPVHGQYAGVALGVLVLLPWGALRLARAVGYTPRSQRAAVGAVLVLAVAAQGAYYIMPGFQVAPSTLASSPAMMAVVVGMFATPWAACCRRPVSCGVAIGVGVLFNVGIIPGVALVCAALLFSSGASFGQIARWTASASAAGLLVCSWWLVPFVSGSARWVRWEIPLSDALRSDGYALTANPMHTGTLSVMVITVVGIAAMWSVHRGQSSCRRLAISALVAVIAATLADSFGFLRADRWLPAAVLSATLAGCGLLADEPRSLAQQPVPKNQPIAVIIAVSLAIKLRFEILPLALWLLFRPFRIWACTGALAWAVMLIFYQDLHSLSTVKTLSLSQMASDEQSEAESSYEQAEQPQNRSLHHLLRSDRKTDPAGLVYTEAGGSSCQATADWDIAAKTHGRIRHLNPPNTTGFNQTSESAEFIEPLRVAILRHEYLYAARPHWLDAWRVTGGPNSSSYEIAEMLGASWYVTCDATGDISIVELPAVIATGVAIAPYYDKKSWHRSAVQWWVSSTDTEKGSPSTSSDDSTSTSPAMIDTLTQTLSRVPTMAIENSAYPDSEYPTGQAAVGVSLTTSQDSLTVEAERAGWVWLRVPWDPYWRSESGTPVNKGGPGHLVMWAQEGINELNWSVPDTVNTAAAASTGVAALMSAVLAAVNRRRGWSIQKNRPTDGQNP